MIQGWRFTAEGKTYDLDLSDITGVESREFRIVVGVPLTQIDDAIQDGRLDMLEALSAVRWFYDHRENPDLTYADVLKNSTYQTYTATREGDASPPVEAAAAEVAAGPGGEVRDPAVASRPSD